MRRGREGSSCGGSITGSIRSRPGRPQSWCVGMWAWPVDGQEEDEEPNDGYGEEQSQPPAAADAAALASRGLHRSSSYQALQSALATLYRLDDFTMEKIGAGFFSEVFKVRHGVTGDVMVLKMNKLMSNRHNMLREVELMNRLHHPNILRYYGVCVDSGQVHALTEYINGGPLDALLADKLTPLPWYTRVTLARDIAMGMSYLHHRGVLHRDLTSKNVLIKHTEEGGEKKIMAVIADFGLAAPIPHDENVRLQQVGSPYWMAPEMIRGKWYNHRVDVFSFGILVCEIIARCDADPDILPRTHNFGVHYLAFSQLCPHDCPANFLQLAFQCCQIDPVTRPTFKDLTWKLESILMQVSTPQFRKTHRRPRISHLRSLSDDAIVLNRNQLLETAITSPCTVDGKSTNSSITTEPVSEILTLHEILENMSAADPYFTATSLNVNPFTQLKLPARSQLALREGLRYCHSLPEPPYILADNSSPKSYLTAISKLQHTSDSSLCPRTDSSSQTDLVLQSESRSNKVNESSVAIHKKQCTCISSVKRNNGIEELTEFKCTLHGVTVLAMPSLWPRDLCTTRINTDEEVHPSFNSNLDIGCDGQSNEGSNSHVTQITSGPSKRRGSGESGFFSVEDIDAGRLGTPELCLSFSELSSASFLSMEEDIDGALCLVQRSSSVVTDSSEDLSSLGCCHDPYHSCDLASLTEGDEAMHYTLTDYEGEQTDIKHIVEFFERNSILPYSHENAKNCIVSTRTRRQGCLVPHLTHRFSSVHSGSVSGSHQTNYITNFNKLYSTKDSAIPKSICVLPTGVRIDRTCKMKEKPKTFITEGTVRAKRDIFEAK